MYGLLLWVFWKVTLSNVKIVKLPRVCHHKHDIFLCLRVHIVVGSWNSPWHWNFYPDSERRVDCAKETTKIAMGVRIASHANFSITTCQKYHPFVIADSSSYNTCYVRCGMFLNLTTTGRQRISGVFAFKDLYLSLVHSWKLFFEEIWRFPAWFNCCWCEWCCFQLVLWYILWTTWGG